MTRMVPTFPPHATQLVCALLVCAGTAVAAGQPSASVDGGMAASPETVQTQTPVVDAELRKESSKSSANAEEVDALTTRAAHLRQWMAGELDPTVDVRPLIHFDLIQDSALLGGLTALLAPKPHEMTPSIRRASLSVAAQQAKASEQDSDPLIAATAKLRLALIDYVRLSDVARARLIAVHAERQARYHQLKDLQASLSTKLQQLTQRFQRVQAFMAGTLDPTLDLQDLLIVELLPDNEKPDFTLDAAGRLTRRKAEKQPAWEAALVQDCEQLLASLQDVKAGLATLITSYASLPIEGQQALQKTHEARRAAWIAERQRQEAEKRAQSEPPTKEERTRSAAEVAQASANAEREAALKAAEEARTEAQRLVAAEKARVLGRKAELAAIRARLAEQSTELAGRYDEALGLVRKARELHDRSVLDRTKVADADMLYKQLRAALRRYRGEFSTALGQSLAPQSRLPKPLTPTDATFLAQLDDPELNRMWSELSELRERTQKEESLLDSDSVDKLHDLVVLLNTARLEVLKEASVGLRYRVQGFSAEGVDQARAEVEHMLLLVRYHIVSMPKVLSTLRMQAEGSSLMIALVTIQILLLIVLYQFYRKRADTILERLYRQALSGVAPGNVSRTFARLLWYLRRLHRALGAWAFAAMLFHFLLQIELLPEIAFVWIVLQWFYAGWTAVMMVDAFAARQNNWMRQRREEPGLRLRSLRAVALFLLGTGLLLSLTERSVGQGAIYAWTEYAALFFVVPVALRLAHLWRAQIKSTMDARVERTAFVNWVSTNIERPFGVFAALIGGSYLLGEGLWRWLVRWLADFDIFQRLAAYLFRRKIQDRSHAAAAAALVSVNEPYPLLSSDFPVPDSALVADIHRSELERVAKALPVVGSLILVVGDRGLGKSTLLMRAEHGLGEHGIRIACPNSVAELRLQLALVCGLERDADDTALVAGLEAQRCSALLLDDIQALIRPTVFGLREYDSLLGLLRSLRSVVSVVMTCSSAGFGVLQRGRDTLGADHTVRLSPLSRKQIAALVRARCLAQGIKPNFDELVVPRSFDLEINSNEDPLEAGYFRLLWDYAAGNPAVALLYFQRSLFIDDRSRLVVRIFDEPERVQLDRLPANMPFVLRTLMQLDHGDAGAISSCIDMPLGETEDVIELGLRCGYLEKVDGGVRIAMPWLHEINVLLRRQHLLS